MRHLVVRHDDVFMILGDKGVVQFAKAAALRLLGGEKVQVAGTPFPQLFALTDEKPFPGI